jgi:hypothetical protein
MAIEAPRSGPGCTTESELESSAHACRRPTRARLIAGALVLVALGPTSACLSTPYVRDGRLNYPRVRDEQIEAYIPPRPGDARTAYLEAHRECAGIEAAYREQARHGSDFGVGLVLTVGISSAVLGVISGVTLAAAGSEATGREVLERNPQTSTAELQASVDRQNALTWTGGVTGSVGGALDLGALLFWLFSARGDAYQTASAEVRDAINEADAAVVEGADASDAALTRQAALLRRRCRRPQAAVAPLGTYLDGTPPGPQAQTDARGPSRGEASTRPHAQASPSRAP